MSCGLKNYAAAYCTGLLVARRCLTKLGLADMYEGNTEVDGTVVSTEFNGREHFVEEVDEERRPFRCVLDVGLTATTVGNRVFGALKGAVDGGLDIPHNHKKFPGYDKEAKELDADVHKERIFGLHIAEFMGLLKEEDGDSEEEDRFSLLFAAYKAADLDEDNLEDAYIATHAAIREDPSPKHATSAKLRNKESTVEHPKKYRNQIRRSYKQRKDRVRQKKAHAASAAMEEDEEDDE